MLWAPNRPACGVDGVIGQRTGRDRHQIGFVARIQYPDQLRPVLGVVLGQLVGHQHQAAVEQRHDGVHEAGIGRRIGPLRDLLRIGLVGNIEHEHAAVDIGEVAAVRPLRIDVGVVGAEALVDRMPRRRPDVVALPRAGHPPAADLDGLRRIAHVDAAIELVVLRMRRREIARARRAVHVFAVAEPQLVHAARMRPRAIEERNRFRIFRLGNIEQLEAGRLQILLRGLIGHRHHVAAGLQANSSACWRAADRSGTPLSACADRRRRRR